MTNLKLLPSLPLFQQYNQQSLQRQYSYGKGGYVSNIAILLASAPLLVAPMLSCNINFTCWDRRRGERFFCDEDDEDDQDIVEVDNSDDE